MKQEQSNVIIVTAEEITVYPPLQESDGWRAQWYDPDGTRRACRATTEAKLAKKLEPVKARLAAQASLTERLGSELVEFYLSQDRQPADRPWSTSYLEKQTRYCNKYVLPVIANLKCQDIKIEHMQKAVNIPNTFGEGKRARKTIRAIVKLGWDKGYITNQRISAVHWQIGDREAPAARVSVAGEKADYVNPDEIPNHRSISRFAASMPHMRLAPWWFELMPYVSAYAGLRIGEVFALEPKHIGTNRRVISVDWKIVEVNGKIYRELPKGGKRRTTVFPTTGPTGYPLAEMLARRVEEVHAEVADGKNPKGLMFPAPRGGYIRYSNFINRHVIPAYMLAGWRATEDADGPWTWHSLRHAFCTTALNDWNVSITDVSALAGHANTRITMEMYLGSTAGTLARALEATGPL